jgi:hypothetical protein
MSPFYPAFYSLSLRERVGVRAELSPAALASGCDRIIIKK